MVAIRNQMLSQKMTTLEKQMKDRLDRLILEKDSQEQEDKAY